MLRFLCCVQDFLTEQHKADIALAAERAGLAAFFFETATEAGEVLRMAEVVYCSKADVAKEARSAKWVASSWAGVSPFLQPGVLPEGCLLTKGSGTYGVTISEYVVAMTINLLKRCPEYLEEIREHKWTGGRQIRSVYGSRVTVIGTGDLGQNIAVRMQALGAKSVTGINYSGRNPGAMFSRTCRFTGIESILPETDILVCCAPETPDTAAPL